MDNHFKSRSYYESMEEAWGMKLSKDSKSWRSKKLRERILACKKYIIGSTETEAVQEVLHWWRCLYYPFHKEKKRKKFPPGANGNLMYCGRCTLSLPRWDFTSHLRGPAGIMVIVLAMKARSWRGFFSSHFHFPPLLFNSRLYSFF